MTYVDFLVQSCNANANIHQQVEVDIIVEHESRLIPIEIKSTSTPRPEMARSIESFKHDIKDKATQGFVVHTGDRRLPLSPGITGLPFGQL